VPFHCALYGLRVESDCAIPGVTPLAAGSQQAADLRPDLRVDLRPSGDFRRHVPEEPPWYTSAYLDEQGNPALKIWKEGGGAVYRFHWTDGMEFCVSREGDRAWSCGQETRTVEDIAGYFLGPVMGFLLKLRSVTCLHASAVVAGDSCIAFAGGSGTGKSTTAAAFAQRGFPVLSDDIVAVMEQDGGFQAPAAQPYVCLWPESVEILFGSRDALPPPAVVGDKHHFSVSPPQRGEGTVKRPISRIYFLGERGVGQDFPRVAPLAPQEAFVELLANTYANRLADDGMREREFKLLGRMAASLPVRRIHAHENPSRLSELCDVVLRDMASRAEKAFAAVGDNLRS